MNNMKNYIQTLKRFNAWRRGEETIEMPNPVEIGQAIDRLIDELASLELSVTAWKTEAAIWKEEALSPQLMNHHKN
mgnify:CR=1 FL=1|tara:strand:- start:178 stop:405 length:228 start_codon:yes stop_codon:yes gene_type:complete